MDLWQYLTEAIPASLGWQAWLAMSVSLLVAIWSIALPKARFGRRPAAERRGVGPKAYALRAELWVKVGVAIAVWCIAFIFSLLLRLVGTPGLTTRLLTAYVILVLPFLVGYVVLYRLVFYPRYLEVSLRIDSHKSYEPAAKKGSSKKARVEAPQKPRVNLLPGKAMIGAGLGLVYYLATAFVGYPPGVAPANHDHLWYQTSTLLVGLLGYLMGLILSLGDEQRPLLPWLRMRQAKDESRAH